MEALESCRATLGDRHPLTMTSMNNVAGLLQAQGKLNEAMQLWGEALEGNRLVHGDCHPDTSSATLAEGHRKRLRAHGLLADIY